MTTPDAFEWITIPEAAQRLQIGERRLRRLLARPEYASRTVTVTRETRTGTRTAATVSAALLEEIQHHLEIETNTLENAAEADTVTDREERGQSDPPSTAPKVEHSGGTLTRTEGMLSQIVVRQETEILYLRAELQKATDTLKQQSETIASLVAQKMAPPPEPPVPTFRDPIDEAIAASTPRRSWIQNLLDGLRGRKP